MLSSGRKIVGIFESLNLVVYLTSFPLNDRIGLSFRRKLVGEEFYFIYINDL